MGVSGPHRTVTPSGLSVMPASNSRDFADRSVPREPKTRTSENGRFSTHRQA
jgi:hypothetical protein